MWKKVLGTVMAFTTAAGLLTGCGSASAAGSSSAGTSAAGGDSTSAAGSETAGGNDDVTVTIAMGSAWADLIPYNASTGGYYSGLVLGLLYDRLAYIDLEGNITSRAAESWEIGEDKKSITFHLDADCKWSDGEPVTAADYVFAVDMITDPECLANQKATYSILTGVDDSGNSEGEPGIEAVDDYTITYYFDDCISESVTFPSYFYLYLPLPEHLLSDCAPADYLTNELWNAPVGSGPMVFESTIAGSELVLASNKDYQLGAPDFGKLIFRVMATTNMASALISGDVDLAYPPMSKDDIDSMEGIDGLEVVHLDIPTQPWMVMVNQLVYDDARIRKALDLAIDRESIAAMIQGAVAIESPIMSSTKYYDDACTYTYDPDAAKALLDEVIAEGGFDPSAEFIISTPSGTRERVANILQQNFSAIGINASIQVMEAATMFSGLYDGSVGVGLVNMTMQTNPMYLRGMLTDDAATFINMKDNRWDEYYTSFMAAASEEEEISIVHQMQADWMEEEPIIFYAANFEDYAHSTKLSGEVGLEDAGYQNIPVWEWVINK